MTRFSDRAEKIRDFWLTVFTPGPSLETCMVISVTLLAILYFVALLWLVPWSLIKAFR